MRRVLFGIGIALGLGTIAIAPLTACSCGPTDPRPTMQSCSDPSAVTVSALAIEGLEERYGAQGGFHVQFALRITGTGLGRCAAQRTRMLAADGELMAENASNVPLSGDATSATSGLVLLFPGELPSESGRPARVVVELAGVTAEARLGDWGPDGGPSDGSTADGGP